MLRSHLLLAMMGTAAVASLAVACGDDAGTGGGGGGSSTPAGVSPPPRPEDAPVGDGAGTIFGASHIYIGTKTRAGVESADAWKDFGYDLDHQVTASDFSNHCTPAGGAAPNNTFPDGTNGIDNAFGKVLLPIIKTAAATSVDDLEASLNEAITGGSFTIIMNLKNLGSAADYSKIDAGLLAGKEGEPPVWKTVPEFPEVPFANSYLAGNTWVSGDQGTVSLNIGIAGFSLALDIKAAYLTMDLSSAHDGATGGVVAGVLDTEAFIDQLRDVLGAVQPSFCDGAAVEGILNQIRQASDIMKDGSNGAGQECDGISIGIGFDASVITLNGEGSPADPVDPPCQEGGGNAGGGGTGGAGGG